MGGGIPKPAEISEDAGHSGKGARKYRSKVAGLGRNVQFSGAVGAIICQQELGGVCGDAQGPDGVLPLGGVMDHRDYRKTRGRRRLGATLGSGGYGSCGDLPNWGVHQEAAGKHRGEGGLMLRL